MGGAAQSGNSAQALVARAINKWSNTDLKANREAGKLLDEALQREPDYVPAMTTRVWHLWNESELDSGADFARMARRMDELSARAVELEDGDPNAWHARSLALAFRGKLDAALEANAVARRLDPTKRNIRNLRGWYLTLKGQPDEALQVLAESRAAFPDDDPLELRLACTAYLQLGNYARAIELCEKSSVLQVWYYDHVTSPRPMRRPATPRRQRLRRPKHCAFCRVTRSRCSRRAGTPRIRRSWNGWRHTFIRVCARRASPSSSGARYGWLVPKLD